MLQSMRKGAKTFLAFILFGLLILSFAVWGIGDIFRGAGADPVIAEVGGIEISTVRFQRALRVEMQRLQARLGPNVDQAQLRRLGVPERVLASMINETLFSLGAHGMGIAVSNELVSRTIQGDTSFHRRGRFDRATYRAALSNAGLSERGYEESLRRDSAQRHLASAITADLAVPKSLLNALYRYRNERRVARVLFIPTSAIATVATPDTGALTAYHKKHASRFTAPEYRKLTAAILRPRDLAAEIEVPEDQLRAAFEDRKSEFEEPERRTIEQILVGEEALAKKIHAALKSGRSFKSVAIGMAGHKDGPLALGTLARNQVPVASLGDAAFALAKGAFSAPVKSALGWHIVRVSAIIPAKISTFAEIRPRLLKEMQKEMAVEALVKLANELEDALGGGATLEEAAGRLNIKLTKFAAIDAKGNDENGKPAARLPKAREFLIEAFQLPTGRESLLVETDEGTSFIVRVDAITPSALRPLDKVRAQVAAAWRADRRRAAVRRRAENIANKINGGEELSTVTYPAGATVRTTAPFLRTGKGSGKNLSLALVAKIFAAKPQQAVAAPTKDGYAVAVLKEIKDARPGADPAGVKAVRQALGRGRAADLLDQFAGALKDEYDVNIHEATFKSLIER